MLTASSKGLTAIFSSFFRHSNILKEKPENFNKKNASTVLNRTLMFGK
jgi:hypothetical protein